jgi:hypothetical protein
LAYSVSFKGRKSMLIMKTLWTTNFNFVKDIPTIYVNFSISVQFLRKNRRHYYHTTLHNNWPWRPCSPLYSVYRVYFPGVKWLGCSINHPLQSSTKVKERAELHLYSPSGP